ncbi:RNA chaperone ProQ [Aliidiomarina haloalkalitolerans]|uniref:RNA chaperone ProQ n=1 Tax=Aliidiomarina haloalkalitolerans TaxID=859059 RepID=A0A432VYC3_9GAMM|nr:RNA chaperone ProQ [Aliidiomarina haloalkalitolerans]MCL4409654.1 RNA chaperone ProQ [Gammaproteobacteria bacterium]RUO21646.1 RNA chaperone ProQ [Aliidiomarina haloalkalitolerans]
MENTAKLSTSKEVIAYLATKFPSCFTLEGEARPLKIGIFDDLAARLADDDNVSKTRLRAALRQYTNSWRYLRGVKVGVQRVDLDGADAGAVEEDHQTHALEQLKESQAKVKEKQAKRAVEGKSVATKGQKPANKTGDNQVRDTRRKKVSVPRRASVKTDNKATATTEARTVSASKSLETVQPEQVVVGQKIQIKLGGLAVQGTVEAIEKDEVQVQLPSGMTVRVARTELFRS